LLTVDFFLLRLVPLFFRRLMLFTREFFFLTMVRRMPVPAIRLRNLCGSVSSHKPRGAGKQVNAFMSLYAGSMKVFVGTAGWTVPKQHLALFSNVAEVPKPSHLDRYTRRFSCTEINSSFHRPHRRATWERWAETTPDGFRFAVKAPKAITHTARLVNTGGGLLDFFNAVHGLGEKLGPVLVQLPPKLAFDEGVAHEFFTTVRELHSGAVVLEPRHPSWFTATADRLLHSFEIARVAADPPKGSKLAASPGGWPAPVYWRLHGSPRTYYSEYDKHWLEAFAKQLQMAENMSLNRETWVIFDNTALGHATANAISLEEALR
jgi:uncharacterized protein YecE (DUF72 family)